MKAPKPQIHWKEIPMVRIVLPYLLGLILNGYFDWELEIGVSYLTLLGLIVFLLGFRSIPYQWRYYTSIPFFFWFFLFGIGNSYIHKITNHDDYFVLEDQQDSFFVYTKIKTIKGQSNWLSVQMQVDSMGNHAKHLMPACGSFLAILEKGDRSLNEGEDLLLYIKPHKITAPKNPKAFDQRQYWASQNIYHQAFVSKDNWHKMGENQAGDLVNWSSNMRRELLEVFEKYFPNSNERKVAEALILGYKNDMDISLKKAYANTGAMHVLAVSGLHVGIVSGILLFLFGLILPGKQLSRILIRTILVIVSIWCFALITGMAASVMRAALMFSLLIIGRAIRRDSDIYNILATSAFILLLLDPFLILDIGFQLSYAAVLGIVFFQKRIYQLIYFEEKWMDWIWSLTAVSLAAQLSTLPFTLYYFHQFPIYFWLSGLVVVPFATLILTLGLGMLAFEFFWPFLAAIFSKILYWFIWLMNALVFMIEKMPLGLLEDIWLQNNELMILGLGMLLLIYAFWLYSKKYLFLALTVFIFSVGLHFYYKKEALSQNELIVYYTRKGLIADAIQGRKTYAFRSNNIEDRSINYAAQAYRGSRLQNLLQESIIEEMEGNISVGGLGFYMIGERSELGGKEQTFDDKDILILYGKARIDFDRIKEHPPHIIVFAASVPNWLLKKWKQQCIELGIPFYDIKELGAFVHTI